MSKKTGLGHRFYIAGRDISGDVGSISKAANPSVSLSVTAINQSGHERILGKVGGELSWGGFFNDATDQIHDALKGLIKTSRIASWLLGTTRGDQVANLVGRQMNYDYVRGEDGSLTNACQLLSDSGFGLEWAELLAAKVTHSSATDETGIDNGASSAAGGVGFLHHFPDGTPTGTIEYDIEDSSDSTNGVDGSWANLLAFSDVATPYAAIAERITVAGTVERWVRASTNGTFTDAPFSMSFLRNA